MRVFGALMFLLHLVCPVVVNAVSGGAGGWWNEVKVAGKGYGLPEKLPSPFFE